MTPENCKKLLEAGILQAYAEGTQIEYRQSNSKWVFEANPSFNMNPSQYRIKPEPQFKVGDLVRVDGEDIATIENIEGTHAMLRMKERGCTCRSLGCLTPVKEVRTPFTFEQAVKAIVEHGIELLIHEKVRQIEGLLIDTIRLDGSGVMTNTYAMNNAKFLDGTPFCNITYEDVK